MSKPSDIAGTPDKAPIFLCVDHVILCLYFLSVISTLLWGFGGSRELHHISLLTCPVPCTNPYISCLAYNGKTHIPVLPIFHNGLSHIKWRMAPCWRVGEEQAICQGFSHPQGSRFTSYKHSSTGQDHKIFRTFRNIEQDSQTCWFGDSEMITLIYLRQKGIFNSNS